MSAIVRRTCPTLPRALQSLNMPVARPERTRVCFTRIVTGQSDAGTRDSARIAAFSALQELSIQCVTLEIDHVNARAVRAKKVRECSLGNT